MLASASAVSGCPESGDGPTTNTSPQQVVPEAPKGKHAGLKASEIQYEGTRLGLERIMRDLRIAITSTDEQEIAVLLESLRLPEHSAWFVATFGDALGATLIAEYQPYIEEIGVLAEHLTGQYAKGLTNLEIDRFQTPKVPTATGYQSEALRQMHIAVPLYSVRLISDDGKRSFHLWSFVHHLGSFRYVGKLHGVAKEKPLGEHDLNEYRLEDAARLAAQAPSQ